MGGKVYVYGGLRCDNAPRPLAPSARRSEERPVVSTRDLIFKRKSLDGFWLKDYVATKYQVRAVSRRVGREAPSDDAVGGAGSSRCCRWRARRVGRRDGRANRARR